MMRETRIVVHIHQLVKVTSTHGHHIKQSESRIEDRDHDDLANYQL